MLSSLLSYDLSDASIAVMKKRNWNYQEGRTAMEQNDTIVINGRRREGSV